MIQDDPINKLKSKTQGYFPLNLDSEEEIAVKEIKISKGEHEKKLTENEGNKLYYKYFMLIGLCKQSQAMVAVNIHFPIFRYNARNSTWFSFWINPLHA